jgi:outer membrane protein assembly factor BamB
VRREKDVLIPTPDYIVALDVSDHSKKYRIPMERLPTLPPAVSSNILLIVTDEFLHGYDLHDRSLKWEKPTSATYIQGAAPVAFSDQFIVQDGNRLRCIKARNGSQIWEHRFDARLAGFAATHETVTVLRTANRSAELIAFDTGSGRQKWSLETHSSKAIPAIGENVYTVSDTGQLTAVQDGDAIWKVETHLTNPEAISIADEYVILGPDDENRFVGISKGGQTQIWQTELDFASYPLVTSDSAFVPTANDGILALNIESGERQHTYSEARFIDYLVPHKGGFVLSRQPDNRVGFLDFN